MAYKSRTTAPSTTDKHWIHTSKGGLNDCILISGKSCIPNCVGYAWGRFYEIMGKRPRLSRRNAEDWFGYTQDGYKRGQTPKLGAVICWRKGKAGNSADGAGHVAIVEKINADESIVISESGYKAFKFRTSTLKKPYKLTGYTLQGFIYNPEVKEETPKQEKQEKPAVSIDTALKVGDKVKMQKNAPVYDQTNKFSSWVYDATLYVREIKGSKAIISTVKSGAITGAVDKKYLTKI